MVSRSQHLAVVTLVVAYIGVLVFGCFAFLAFDRPMVSPTRHTSRVVAMLDSEVDAAFDDRGQLVGILDGQQVELPEVHTDYDVDIRGDVVAVLVTQRFFNDTGTALDARYQFPLHHDAAVYAVRMVVGEQVVEAEIREREVARLEFLAAAEAGQTAALTEQLRPNLFQQSVANIASGDFVEIQLRYTHTVLHSGTHYELALPLGIGARYVPPHDAQGLPVLPANAPPVAAESFAIDVRIAAGMPLQHIESATHALDVRRLGANDARVMLRPGATHEKRDFVLRYRLAAEDISGGVLSTYDEVRGEGYYSILLESPAELSDDEVQPREMVFVFDCSGSMSGQPLATAKRIAIAALRGLRPIDTFRIVEFSGSASEYSTEAIAATPRSVKAAVEYVTALSGGGGTEVMAGLEQALAPVIPDGQLRVVTFMTDGYVGNDVEVVQYVHRVAGDARLITVGLGSSTNRFLLNEMAIAGRGFTRVVDPREQPEAVAREVAARLETPAATNLKLLVGDVEVPLPDLFLGQSVRLTGTYTTPTRVRYLVRGETPQGPFELPLEADLAADYNDGDAVRLVWARDEIARQMQKYYTPLELRDDTTNEKIEATVTAIGLAHSLVTEWTSFVAVAEQPMYASAQFHGGVTPEPGLIGGLLVMSVGAFSARRRKQKRD